MNEKSNEVERLERAAHETPSLARAQALADAADRLRGQAAEKEPRPRLFPVFRN